MSAQKDFRLGNSPLTSVSLKEQKGLLFRLYRVADGFTVQF